MDYAFDHPSPTGLSSSWSRTLIGQNETLSFSLNGLSKAAGMPQLKLGWIAINGPAAVRAEGPRPPRTDPRHLSFRKHSGAKRARALCSKPALNSKPASRARIAQNRLTLEATLQNSPVHTLHAEGGWSAILQLPNIQKEEVWAARLPKRTSSSRAARLLLRHGLRSIFSCQFNYESRAFSRKAYVVYAVCRNANLHGDSKKIPIFEDNI